LAPITFLGPFELIVVENDDTALDGAPWLLLLEGSSAAVGQPGHDFMNLLSHAWLCMGVIIK